MTLWNVTELNGKLSVILLTWISKLYFVKVKLCQFHSTVRQIWYLCKKDCLSWYLSIKKVTLKKHWRCGTTPNSTETPGYHTILIVFDNSIINYQRIELNFSQLIKHLLFYISLEICKHSLIKIDFITSVYEPCDNLSYITAVNIYNAIQQWCI